MTSSDALKRSEKSQNLKVLHLEDSPWYYVESEEGKICYKVGYENEQEYLCNCADFAKNYAKDPTFKCKHVMAVMNSITDNDLENVRYLERWRPKLDEKFIMKIDDKDFVLYAGLLDVAHQKNLCSVDVELIQFPSEENKQTAICKATVKTIDGKIFSDIGDANPQNCNSKVAKHIIRMASTRAKARAFRDMDNIGMTALEELGDLNEVIGNNSTAQKKINNVKPFVKPEKKAEPAAVVNANTEAQEQPSVNNDNANTDASTSPVEAKPKKTKAAKPGNGNGGDKPEKVPLMSEAQKSAMFNLSRRRGFSIEDIETRVKDKYNVTVEDLTSANAGEFIRFLQQAS
jgi:predicted nucleic acid-binding Zn finger protein